MENKNKDYLPAERTGYAPSKNALESVAEDGSKTKLPNTVKDPVVCNNISTAEFDYTEEPNLDSE